jgi:acylphosphatase
MLTYSEILFKRNSYEDGFGFECMKRAYQLRLKGRMDYSLEGGVRILIEGEKENISSFLEWIELNIKETIDTLYHTYLNYSGHYTEFDIYRHTV